MAINIELFAGNCYLCSNAEKMVRGVMGPECRLTIYNLAEKQNRQIGNGRKMFEGMPEYNELVKCSIEHGCKGHLLK